MLKAEFDKFAEEYHDIHKNNIKLSGETPEFFAEYKISDVFQLFSRAKQAPKEILDFGAGIGTSVPYFRKFFPDASLTCLDVSEKSLHVGRTRFPDLANFQAFDGIRIPSLDDSFDLVFAACVFHHIPESLHSALLKEWQRVLKPGGKAVIFEHNPLNPLTRHAVNTCPFDENAVLIHGPVLRRRMKQAGFQNTGLRYRLFIPGALSALRPLEQWMCWCPLGAQYFVYSTKN